MKRERVGAEAGALELEVRPAGAFRIGRGSSDRTLRIAGGVATRLLQVEGRPVLTRAWQPGPGRVRLRADAVDPRSLSWPRDAVAIRAGGRRRGPAGRGHGPPRRASHPPVDAGPPAEAEHLEVAVARLRFALAVDVDLAEFQARFRRDPLLGPLIARRPGYRPLRAPWPWEALAKAVVGQLIEASRAAVIERRIIGRWGARLGEGRGQLRDVPGPATIAGRAPAELQAMDLSAARSVALRRLARDVTGGSCELAAKDSDRRLLAVPEIGPWTVQCLGLYGRGDMDSLPAGDLGYIKLVGRLAELGRRATVPEVEEFYAPYQPYRGLAGALTLSGLYRTVAQGPPLRLAA